MKFYIERFAELSVALVLITLACELLGMPAPISLAMNCLCAAAFINLVGPLFDFDDEDKEL